jgi:hypothetical protein
MDLFILLSILFVLVLLLLIIKFKRLGGFSRIRARGAYKKMILVKRQNCPSAGLFSANEKAFYAVLCHACKGRGIVFGKLSAIDVVNAQAVLAADYGLRKYRKIDYQVFDFIVCDPLSLSIIAVINCHELNAAVNKKSSTAGQVNAHDQKAWRDVGVKMLTCNHSEKNMLALRKSIFN